MYNVKMQVFTPTMPGPAIEPRPIACQADVLIIGRIWTWLTKLYSWQNSLSPPHYRNRVRYRLKLYVCITEDTETFQNIYSFIQFK